MLNLSKRIYDRVYDKVYYEVHNDVNNIRVHFTTTNKIKTLLCHIIMIGTWSDIGFKIRKDIMGEKR